MAIESPLPPTAEPVSAPLPPILEPESPARRKLPWQPLLALGLAALAGWGWQAWQVAAAHVETDNAAVAGHLHTVSARVAGTVGAVAVEDHQLVKAGQLLFSLDDRDARIKVAQAEAALQAARRQARAADLGRGASTQSAAGQLAQARGQVDVARAGVEAARAAIAQAQAGVPAAEAQLAAASAQATQAEDDAGRSRALYAAGGLSRQQWQLAETALVAARAQASQARQAIAQARARVIQAREDERRAAAQASGALGGVTLAGASGLQAGVSAEQAGAARAGVAQAEAGLADARQQLAYTRVLAPCDGRIAKRAVELGQRVQPGQEAIALIEPNPWVVANFKETQLERLRVGQPVEVSLDAFPGQPLSGRVESFSPAAGSLMALLPPDNATGNFTKVVQRVPVKIALAPQGLQGREDRIVPGMSAVVRVTVR